LIDWNLIISLPKLDNIKIKSKYRIGNITYEPYEYHKLLFSRFIEIEDYLTEENNMSKIIATLILNDKLTEENLFETIKEVEENIKVLDAAIIMGDYMKWRKETLSDYENLFTMVNNEEEKDEEEEEEKEKNDNGWLKIAYSLTNDDITKTNEIFEKGIIEILNWLSYLKEKRDEERDRNKNTIKH